MKQLSVFALFDQCGCREPGNEWNETDLRFAGKEGAPFVRVQFFHRVIAAFDVDIGRDCGDFAVAAAGMENDDSVDEVEAGEQKCPVVLFADRPGGTFQFPDGFIGIQQNQQSIGGLPGGDEVFGVSPVQKIETAVGQREPLSFPFQLRAPFKSFRQSHGFVRVPVPHQSTLAGI